MKAFKVKILMTAGLLCCGIAAALPAQAQQYTISGTVEGLPDGATLQLRPMSHENEKPVGEVTVQGGKFQFTGTATEPIAANIVVKDCYGTTTLMLENTNITVTGSVSKSKAHDGVDMYNWNVTVSGSPLTDQLNEHKKVRQHLNDLYIEKDRKHRATWDQYHALKDEAEKKAFEQTEAYKDANQAESDFFKKAGESFDSLIMANKDTFWGPLLAVQEFSYFTPDQRALYEKFSDAAKQSYYGRKMKEELWPAGAVGQKIEIFAVKDEQGKTITFADLAKDKKYVLIDFWASWCAPCRKEIPNVKRQYELYKDKGFEVVSISIDRDAKAWKKAVDEEQLQWPNFLSGEVTDQFKVKAVPTMYLVTADGTIVAENNDARGEALAKKLAEVFAQ